MRDIDFYLDNARKRNGLRSDRKLGEALGMKVTAVSFWRRRACFPQDETMIELAALAGIAPEQALLDLNAWRCRGIARKTYVAIAQRMAAAGLLCFFFMIYSPARSYSEVITGIMNKRYREFAA